MVSVLCFFVKHTPFWAIATLIISGEFGYLYLLKNRRKVALLFAFASFVSLCALGFYYWHGGPEKSVEVIVKFFD